MIIIGNNCNKKNKWKRFLNAELVLIVLVLIFNVSSSHGITKLYTVCFVQLFKYSSIFNFYSQAHVLEFHTHIYLHICLHMFH